MTSKKSGKLDAEFSYAGIRDRRPLFFAARAAKEHFVTDVSPVGAVVYKNMPEPFGFTAIRWTSSGLR
jgi:hypothetical protein